MQAAGPCERVDDIELAVRSKRDALRTAKRRSNRRDLAATIEFVDGIVGPKRWRGDGHLAPGTHGEMKRRHAWRQRRKRGGATVAHAEDRPRSIAHEHPAFLVERDAARHAKIRGDLLWRAIRRDAIHRALEPAPPGQLAVGPDRHRRRVYDPRGKRLARAGGGDAEDRNRRFLAS